jgi:hypothetical protein
MYFTCKQISDFNYIFVIFGPFFINVCLPAMARILGLRSIRVGRKIGQLAAVIFLRFFWFLSIEVGVGSCLFHRHFGAVNPLTHPGSWISEKKLGKLV